MDFTKINDTTVRVSRKAGLCVGYLDQCADGKWWFRPANKPTRVCSKELSQIVRKIYYLNSHGI